jgi:hypothetical protein
MLFLYLFIPVPFIEAASVVASRLEPVLSRGAHFFTLPSLLIAPGIIAAEAFCFLKPEKLVFVAS